MLFHGKSSKGVDWLLVCLGNCGRQYENTRHNIGFMAADLLAQREQLRLNKVKFHSLTDSLMFGGARVLVMKPQTYMNLSGEAVREAVHFYKLPPEQVLVIYDDVSLPLGKLRVRPFGSAGGHNGIKNIIAQLSSEAFVRIKIGVGSPPHPDYDMVDWVIGHFTPQERRVVNQALCRALDAAECVIAQGWERAQNQFN